MSSEPPLWTRARNQRLAQQHPELGLAGDAGTLMGVDAMKSAQGQPPSDYSQSVMRLAAMAAQTKAQP